MGDGAFIFEVWLSLVERYVRDVEAAGSNPVTSTRKKQVIFLPAFSYFIGIFALQVNSKDLKAF